MSCKKGGYINIRHNDVRDLAAKFLSEVCHDVWVEPTLFRLTGQRMEHCSAIETNKVRLDIRSRAFWIRGHQVFSDIRVFDPNACRYSNLSLSPCYATNEKEKKRNYNQRILKLKKEPLAP